MVACIVSFLLGSYWNNAESRRGIQWKFSAAAAEGNIAEMERLHRLGANIDAIPMEEDSIQGFPALQLAAENGQATAVVWLLEHGAEPNRISADVTPLGGARRNLRAAQRAVDILEKHGGRPSIH